MIKCLIVPMLAAACAVALRAALLNEGVMPETNCAAAGTAGGPFVPATMTYTLTGPVEQSVCWTAAAAAPWLTVSPPSGVLAAGRSVDIAITINASANALPLGRHEDTIAFDWHTFHGDMDGDGRIDADDVPLFADVATGANADADLYGVADMDENGAVDGRDVDLLTEAAIP